MATAADQLDDAPLLTDLGPLGGLPPGAKFINVVGKRPIEDAWNSNADLWLTAEQALKERNLRRNYTGTGLMTGQRCDRLCWLDFDGEERGELGEIVKSASLDFEHLFLKPVSELPPCPINISGREGRFRALLRVPQDWVEQFHGFSITGSEMPTKAFEFLYEKAGGKPFHAVIDGSHPDGQGWFYRWKEGCSPSEVPIPDMPSWMIAGLVRHIQRKVLRKTEKEAAAVERTGEAQPMDLLSPGKQWRLLKSMQKHWPYRGGKAGTGYAGDYGRIRRLVLSLAKGIDNWEVFALWLVGSEWDKKSDWDGTHGSAAVNGGELMSFASSVMSSDTGGEEVTPWGAAWRMAAENGWKPPAWALPPREFDPTDIGISTKKRVEQLKQAMEVIEMMDTPLDRLAATQNLQKGLGATEKEMRLLLQQLAEEGDSPDGQSLDEVLATTTQITPAIESLLALGCVTLVASEGGVGKSVLLYRIAEAAATGGKLFGQLQAVEGNTLIVQKDESDKNLASKWRLMGAEMTAEQRRRIEIRFKFNGGMMPELRQWIREHKARYVLMDSFGSLFGSGADLSDAEAGIYMYQLNAMASEENCAILMTHHLRKAPKDKGERKKVTAGDLYGSAYIVNGSSDIWGLVRDPQALPDEPAFLLNVIKPRSGVSQAGDEFRLLGSMEDLSLTLDTYNASATGVAELRQGDLKLLKFFRNYGEEDAQTMVQASTKTGVKPRTARRSISKLHSEGILKRVQLSTSEKGRPSYGYWAE